MESTQVSRASFMFRLPPCPSWRTALSVRMKCSISPSLNFASARFKLPPQDTNNCLGTFSCSKRLMELHPQAPLIARRKRISERKRIKRRLFFCRAELKDLLRMRLKFLHFPHKERAFHKHKRMWRLCKGLERCVHFCVVRVIIRWRIEHIEVHAAKKWHCICDFQGTSWVPFGRNNPLRLTRILRKVLTHFCARRFRVSTVKYE